MANQIETFGLNVHMHEGFDCDDAHLKSENLVEDFGPVFVSTLTPNGLSTSESIAMPGDLYGEAKIAWEVQLIFNLKTWVLHYMLSFPWHFFVLNDGSKLDPILLQTMHVICHFVCQSYSDGSTTKRRKGIISYN